MIQPFDIILLAASALNFTIFFTSKEENRTYLNIAAGSLCLIAALL